MSKLSLHCQEFPGWLPEFMEVSGVLYIKIVDPPEQDPFPGVRTIGRTFITDEESNDLIWQGTDGGIQWFKDWKEFYLSHEYVYAWEGPNQPQPMADKRFRKQLNKFTIAWANLMRKHGLKTVGMNWSVGWPDIGHAPDMGPAIEKLDFLGLHEYSAQLMWNNETWNCLRYRRTVKELTDAGYKVPPIIIGECGIDGGVLGTCYAKKGWRDFVNEDVYLGQLVDWYSKRLDEDDIVEVAFIFTLCSWDWHPFNIIESLGMKLAEAIKNDGAVAPP